MHKLGWEELEVDLVLMCGIFVDPETICQGKDDHCEQVQDEVPIGGVDTE